MARFRASPFDRLRRAARAGIARNPFDPNRAAARVIALLAAILMSGGAVAQTGDSLPSVDYLVVRKAARVMELYSQGRWVRTIPAIQLGDEPAGPKRFQGDERTPEGRYTIDYGNAESRYYLSLHISYPDARDRAFAASYGRHPGGAIFIHGQPNGYRGRVPGDWTDGCIAVSNEEIAYLWQVVPDGAVIDIVP